MRSVTIPGCRYLMGRFFFVLNLLLFASQSDALVIRFRFRDFASRLNSTEIVSQQLKFFISTEMYEEAVLFLDNPLLNLSNAYRQVCSKFEIEDIKKMAANPNLTTEMLKKLLPPYCLCAASGALAQDPSIIHMLPNNVLEHSSSVRYESRAQVFKESVLKGLQTPATSQSIIWRRVFNPWGRLAGSIDMHRVFPLESVLEAQRILFMSHLTPNIIKDADDKDFYWMVQICKPGRFPYGGLEVKNRFRFLEVQLFRLITWGVLRKRLTTRLTRLQEFQAPRMTDRILFYEGILSEMDERLRQFINDHSLFLHDRNIGRNLNSLDYDIKDAIKLTGFYSSFTRPSKHFFGSMVSRCSNFLSSSDWMLVLFYACPRRCFEDNSNLNRFLTAFVSKQPSTNAIFELKGHLHDLRIPLQELLTLLSAKQFEALLKDFSESFNDELISQLSFATRRQMFLRQRRHLPLSVTYSKVVMIDPVMIEADADRLQRLQKFKKLILDAYFSGSFLIPNSASVFRGTSSFRRQLVSGVEYLKYFFHLFLSFKDEFYVELRDKSDPHGRPVIVLSPLMSPWVADAFGKCLLSAAMYCYRLPFVLDWDHFKDIMSYSDSPRPDIRMIDYLKNFSTNENSLKIAVKLKDDFEKKNIGAFAATWLNVLKSPSKPEMAINPNSRLQFAKEVYDSCIAKVFTTLKFDPFFKHFNAGEIYSILFYE